MSAEKIERLSPIQIPEDTPDVQTRHLGKPRSADMGQTTNSIATLHDNESGSSAIDRKYLASGKYASQLEKRPSGERPSRAENVNYDLPYLNLLHKDMESGVASDSEG